MERLITIITACLTISPTLEFVAYNCSRPSINMTPLFLLDIKDCSLQIDAPKIEKTSIQ